SYLNAIQRSRLIRRVGGMCAISLPHRCQLAARALDELRRRRDVALSIVPGEVRPQDAELRDLGAGQTGKRAGPVDQCRGGASIALLSGVLGPVAEQIEQPAIERVLIVEFGLRRRLLPGRDGNRAVSLVRGRFRYLSAPSRP